MNISRRRLGLVLPGIAVSAGAQGGRLASKTFRMSDIKATPNGTARSWNMVNGETHAGLPLEMHETELPGGLAPHAPHRHIHEEILFIRDGQVEITIAGQKTMLGPGSAAYIASNDEHGWRNAGATPALYFVLAVGRD
jgi:mannose-6-phosphate isomerase-like protein (cupin superfamily)